MGKRLRCTMDSPRDVLQFARTEGSVMKKPPNAASLRARAQMKFAERRIAKKLPGSPRRSPHKNLPCSPRASPRSFKPNIAPESSRRWLKRFRRTMERRNPALGGHSSVRQGLRKLVHLSDQRRNSLQEERKRCSSAGSSRPLSVEPMALTLLSVNEHRVSTADSPVPAQMEAEVQQDLEAWRILSPSPEVVREELVIPSTDLGIELQRSDSHASVLSSDIDEMEVVEEPLKPTIASKLTSTKIPWPLGHPITLMNRTNKGSSRVLHSLAPQGV